MNCRYCDEPAKDRPHDNPDVCWEHCGESPDGQHRVGGGVNYIGRGEDDILIDVLCRYCGQSQGFIIANGDVDWTA